MCRQKPKYFFKIPTRGSRAFSFFFLEMLKEAYFPFSHLHLCRKWRRLNRCNFLGTYIIRVRHFPQFSAARDSQNLWPLTHGVALMGLIILEVFGFPFARSCEHISFSFPISFLSTKPKSYLLWALRRHLGMYWLADWSLNSLGNFALLPYSEWNSSFSRSV